MVLSNHACSGGVMVTLMLYFLPASSAQPDAQHSLDMSNVPWSSPVTGTVLPDLHTKPSAVRPSYSNFATGDHSTAVAKETTTMNGRTGNLM